MACTSNSAETSPTGLDGGGVGYQVGFSFYPVLTFTLMRIQIIRGLNSLWPRVAGTLRSCSWGAGTCRTAVYPFGYSLTHLFSCPSHWPALTTWLASQLLTSGHCPYSLALSHNLSCRPIRALLPAPSLKHHGSNQSIAPAISHFSYQFREISYHYDPEGSQDPLMPPAPLHCTQRATRLSLIPLVSRLFVYSPAPTPGPFYICIAATGPCGITRRNESWRYLCKIS